MRRSIVGVAVLTLILAGLGPASAGGSQMRGSFTAKAYPYADYLYSYPTTNDTYMCFDGIENVHKVLHPLKAPVNGVLTASIEDFEGEWDLGLFDRRGELVETPWATQWVTQKGYELVSLRVSEGDEVTVAVCNWASLQTEIEVRFEFRRGDGFSAGTGGDRFEVIDPGSKARLHERVPVNFVFLGYERDEIDEKEFLSGLPERYRPLVRIPAIIYGRDDFLGIDYSYDFRPSFTDASYENAFFDELSSLAKTQPLTTGQVAYNKQKNNVLDISESYGIPAHEVERWLVENPPTGIDPSQYTVFFINWHGRRDFKHHLYTKFGEPDSDTGIDFGRYPYSQTIAWGGTPPDDPESGFAKTSRVWFYDLSAGPDLWTRNWNVDTSDLDGDGKVNYRMPPIWEYSKKGFRKPDKLTSDLSKVARYIAIDMLFTTSPLYTPALNSPRLPETVALDVNTYEGAPGFDASEEWVQEKEVLAKFREWLPFYQLSIDEQDLDFYDPDLQKCYQQWNWTWYGPNCYTERPYSIWANFFVHNALRLPDTADDEKADYEASAFNYAQPPQTGWTFGYADDNHFDGTQSFTHTFIDAKYKDLFGMTDIIIHEFGHHFGGSHPHDGYDYEKDVHFGPWTDAYLFGYAGTHNNSIMSYLSTNNEFSQFDRDNMNRWMTSSYLNALNQVAERIDVKLGSSASAARLRSADDVASKARHAFAAHQYAAAVSLAKRAYELGATAATDAGVKIRGRWNGTKVLDKDEGMGGSFSAKQHRRYHRIFVDKIELMKPPEIIEAANRSS